MTPQAGLIPAGAGQTGGSSATGTRPEAHPRRCGADVAQWGRGGRWVGLIPAGAGQTGFEGDLGGGIGAHPRRCGADKQPSVPEWGPSGSSPQVRGRPLATSNVALAIGHSGTTTSSPSECTPPMRGVMKPTFYYGSSLLCRARVRIILHPSSSGCASILISKKWVTGSFFCYSSP